VLVEARRVKEALSDVTEVAVHLTLAVGVIETQLTRDACTALTAELTEATLKHLRRVLRDAQVGKDDVAGIVMVGGSTRMPAVRDAVARYFGRAPLTDLNPDEVVALGAAIQANALAGNRVDGELLLLDVTPLSLGLETMGGLVERVIERNSTLPTAKAQDFTTFKDGQTAMAIHVVQGERELVSDCRSLARFELRGIPPMAAGAARIRVSFQVDADGLLSVGAEELTSGVKAAVTVKPSYGLSDEQIADMLRDGFSSAEEDMRQRSLREARVEAERLILATRAALAVDGDLLPADDLEQLQLQMDRLEHIARSDDATAIETGTEALAQGTEAFAAERMNRGIRQALTGRKVEDV
jgi:molecular chaperone HscA